MRFNDFFFLQFIRRVREIIPCQIINNRNLSVPTSEKSSVWYEVHQITSWLSHVLGEKLS